MSVYILCIVCVCVCVASLGTVLRFSIAVIILIPEALSVLSVAVKGQWQMFL